MVISLIIYGSVTMGTDGHVTSLKNMINHGEMPDHKLNLRSIYRTGLNPHASYINLSSVPNVLIIELRNIVYHIIIYRRDTSIDKGTIQLYYL